MRGPHRPSPLPDSTARQPRFCTGRWTTTNRAPCTLTMPTIPRMQAPRGRLNRVLDRESTSAGVSYWATHEVFRAGTTFGDDERLASVNAHPLQSTVRPQAATLGRHLTRFVSSGRHSHCHDRATARLRDAKLPRELGGSCTSFLNSCCSLVPRVPIEAIYNLRLVSR